MGFNVTLSYDKRADVLYVAFETPSPGTYVSYVENEAGDVLRLDLTSKRVVGVTIMAFSERATRDPVIIPEIGSALSST